MKKLLTTILAVILTVSALTAFAEETPDTPAEPVITEETGITEDQSFEPAGSFAAGTFKVPVEALKEIEATADDRVVIEKKYIDQHNLCFDIRNNTSESLVVYYYVVAYDENENAVMLTGNATSAKDYILEGYRSAIGPGTTETTKISIPEGCEPKGVRAIVSAIRTEDQDYASRSILTAGTEWLLTAFLAMPVYELQELPFTVGDCDLPVDILNAYLMTDTVRNVSTILLRISHDPESTLDGIQFFFVDLVVYGADGEPVYIWDSSITGTAYEMICWAATTNMTFGSTMPGSLGYYTLDVELDTTDLSSIDLIIDNVYTSAGNTENTYTEAWKEAYHSDQIVVFD